MTSVRDMLAVALLLTVLTTGSAARADQVVVTDVSYTHSADTTSDSHYRVSPAAATPGNWQSPIDYTQGSVYVALDVKTKPAGDTPTKFQICFEGTPSYACTDQSPTYTTTGHYHWTSSFSNFYYGGSVDWTKGVKQIALILKDTMNNKPAGDPKYMPTDLHVLVVLLSKNASYVPPANLDGGPGSGSGGTGATGAAGAGGAGKAGAGGGGQKPIPDAGVDAARVSVDASKPNSPAARLDAGAATGAGAGKDGLAGMTTAQAPPAARSDASTETATRNAASGCSTTPSDAGNAWLAGVIAALLLLRRRARVGSWLAR